ncbi:MAG: hypothetical protein FWC28_00695, partial [Proteobacteria bacterium]|nr:hypothetical protein [Pseudomonadota bacterium]
MASLLLNNLGIICPICDFLNPAASRQCPCCGQALLKAQPPLPEAPPPISEPLTPLLPTSSSVNIL